MKLFVIYIGGSTTTSLIELHDMRFVVAQSIEKTYDVLRNTWWGTAESLNLGGYDSKQFTELHRNVFIVAQDKQTAKIKAKAQIQDWEVPHTDSNFEVENIIFVGECLEGMGYDLVLTKTDNPKPFVFTCKYTPIGLQRSEMAGS